MKLPTGIACTLCPRTSERQYFATVEHEIASGPATVRVLVRYDEAGVLEALKQALSEVSE